MFGLGIIEIVILATVCFVIITVPTVLVLTSMASNKKNKQREHDTD